MYIRIYRQTNVHACIQTDKQTGTLTHCMLELYYSNDSYICRVEVSIPVRCEPTKPIYNEMCNTNVVKGIKQAH